MSLKMSLEKDRIDNEISKRRVIDSLIQGKYIRSSTLSFISDDYFLIILTE